MSATASSSTKASRTPSPQHPGAKETVVVAGSLSKTYAMTGWRIGFALAPAPIIGAMMKLQSHSTSNPTSIAQKAALEAMRGSQDSVPVMLAEYRRRRDFVIDRLRRISGVTIAMPKGAFYAYPNVSVAFRSGRVKNSLEFSTQLWKKLTSPSSPAKPSARTITSESPMQPRCTNSSAAWTAFTASSTICDKAICVI